MKFFFAKTDSLYKIFKSLEKIPSHRSVEIFIDPEHSLFDNERWWQQIKDILEKNKIDATFITKNKKNRDYLTSVWLKVNLTKEKNIQKALNSLYLFFFNIKKFHLQTYESKKYLFILVFLFEILLILWILRFIISLIVPNASITIHPSETTETIIYNVRYYPSNDPNSANETRFLYVPFYTWSLNYKHELTISTANSKYISNPSHGEIKIYNKKNQELSLVKNTQFNTSDGLIFRAIDDFTLPAWTENNPSETIITVKADEYDNNWELIGIRWNIPFKTHMYITKLEESSITKDIRAESIEDFYWRDSNAIWTVTDDDIAQLKQKLTDQVYAKKIQIVTENFPITWWFVLPFETITTTTFNNIEIPQSSWDNVSTIKWTAYVTYNYRYVLWSDLYQLFMTYINERQSENNLTIKIDPNTLQFLKDSNTTNTDEIKKIWKTYSISTQINVIQTYDFENDQKQIIPEIKNKIAGMDIDEARNYILTTYDEIWSVKISIPLWYNSIPIVKSRIKIIYK